MSGTIYGVESESGNSLVLEKFGLVQSGAICWTGDQMVQSLMNFWGPGPPQTVYLGLVPVQTQTCTFLFLFLFKLTSLQT